MRGAAKGRTAAHPKRLAVWSCAALALLIAADLATRLPTPLFDAPLSSVLEARDGTLLGAKIARDGQWRFPARAEVPAKYAAAVIAFEDKRFRWHPGVDPVALARAVRNNLRAGEVVSGGSTITMQVIRMSRGNRPRTYREKLVEAALAVRLELGTTKDEVLALYAAHAPFGGNVVGLEAAAWRYFGRGPGDLSWAEAATLAVLPNNPGSMHPGRSRAGLLAKRDRLLNRLRENGTIDAEELELALLEPLPDAPGPLPEWAPHLLQRLAAEAGGAGQRYSSTLDAPLQRLAGDVVARQSQSLASLGIRHAAALVIDNRTFEVVAYVGNSRWGVSQGSGHAIDLVQRPRSTGSILKPFLYARMLDAGEILPETLVPDIPSQFAGYMPENYDLEFRGAVPARDALARSLNVPAVRMLKRHGVDRFYDFLRDMGMETLHSPPGHYGLTLVLGGAEGTLWDITSMYANLAGIGGAGALAPDGHYLRPRLLSGEPHPTAGPAGLSVGAAWLTLDALVEVVRPGTDSQWRVLGDGHRVAWKTGTSYGHRDAWAVGVTPRYTVGVWAGNANGEGRPELTGIGAAAPVLFDIIGRLEGDAWFPMPELHLKQLRICESDGYLAAGGCETTRTWAPRNSHFTRPSPHHRTVHLDPVSGQRVHGRCESVQAMSHESWFVLPPGQEAYYRGRNPAYRLLPAYRADCAATVTAADSPVDFVYPHPGARIYIPVELGGRKGRTVFSAAHRDPEATLHWHLDDRYVGSTRVFHEQALDIAQGLHTLTVVDDFGNRARRRFEVLAKGTP